MRTRSVRDSAVPASQRPHTNSSKLACVNERKHGNRIDWILRKRLLPVCFKRDRIGSTSSSQMTTLAASLPSTPSPRLPTAEEALRPWQSLCRRCTDHGR